MRILLLLLLFFSFNLNATQIHLGMSAALLGPAKQLGLNMKLGVQTYLNKNNEIPKTHKYKLTVLNDSFEPSLASHNMRELINIHNVLAVIGNVGTTTANVTAPIANAKRTLLFGSLSGAEILRKKPADKYIINYRASYEEEMTTIIAGLLSRGIKPENIALFSQNDGYGDNGYYAIFQALSAKGFPESIKKMFHGRYKRNTLNVEDGLSVIYEVLMFYSLFQS